jgi:hypothetical protein
MLAEAIEHLSITFGESEWKYHPQTDEKNIILFTKRGKRNRTKVLRVCSYFPPETPHKLCLFMHRNKQAMDRHQESHYPILKVTEKENLDKTSKGTNKLY